MVQNGSSLTALLDTEPIGQTSVTIPVATYSSFVGGGTFASLAVSPTFSNGASCYDFGVPSADYGNSALSIIVSVTAKCTPAATSAGSATDPTPATSNGGLSRGALIGIAVGCGVGGVLVAVVVVAGLVAHRKRMTTMFHQSLSNQNAVEMERARATAL
jgi:hypothetical protein